jgi:hypothetical protein
MWWHTATHVRGSGGENCRMEWVASTLHTTSEHGVSSITTADAHTSAASNRLNWRPPADLNGLVRFAERRNLVYVHVQSHFKFVSLVNCLFIPHNSSKMWTFFQYITSWYDLHNIECIAYGSVSQPPGRDLVPGPSNNYTGPREFVI